MAARLRKLALTVHIVFSVGWLGGVIAVLALALAGLTSSEPQTVRAVYPAIELTTRYVLVPLAIASLVSGLLQSLVTKWGVFRHYWVVAKLLLSIFATIILLLYTQTVGNLADLAQMTRSSGSEIGGLSPVLHTVAALIVLVTTTALAVFKPRGLTRYGRRRERTGIARTR